jgi:hypothetical protein
MVWASRPKSYPARCFRQRGTTDLPVPGARTPATEERRMFARLQHLPCARTPTSCEPAREDSPGGEVTPNALTPGQVQVLALAGASVASPPSCAQLALRPQPPSSVGLGSRPSTAPRSVPAGCGSEQPRARQSTWPPTHGCRLRLDLPPRTTLPVNSPPRNSPLSICPPSNSLLRTGPRRTGPRRIDPRLTCQLVS